MVKTKLTGAKMQFDVKINNVQSLIDTQFSMKQFNVDTKAHDYNKYNTYDEVSGFIEKNFS